MVKLIRLFSSIMPSQSSAKQLLSRLGGTTFTILSLLFVSQVAFAVTFPTPIGVVNDYAGLMSYQEKVSLEAVIKNFEAQTTNEIVLVIVNDFQGLDSFSYSQQLFDTWKIGKAGKDNGVLFLIGPKEGYVFPERGDVFINVGKGLEGALPDSVTGSILRTELFPQFQAKNYAAGINNTITAIMKATKGEYTAAQTGATGTAGETTTESNSSPIIFIGIFVLIIIIAIIAGSFAKKGKGKSGSSGHSSSSSFTGSSSSSSTSHFGGGKSGGGGAGGSW